MESKLARISGPGKVARGTSELAQRTCGAGKLEEARARWLGELAAKECKLAQARQGCKKHERGVSTNLRCKKVNSHGLADPASLQVARARWLGELAMQESKLAGVSRPGKVARGTNEVARRTYGAANKVSSQGLAYPARLQEARGRWLNELAVQESNLAGLSRPGKVARGTSEVARRTCGAGKKVSSHGLANPARLQEARARWLGELAVQESKIAPVSRPSKVARGTARWLGELAVQECKLSLVSRPGKVARGTSEVARRTCGAGKETRTGWQTRHGFKWHNQGGSANLRCRKKGKLARVSRPGMVTRSTSEAARRTCGGGKHEGGVSANLRCRKVNSHGLAEPARLQEARASWLSELAVQESNLAQAWQGFKWHERGGSANLRCKNVNSHGLAVPARLQEARARWLGKLAVQERKLARVSSPGKVARGTSEVARRTCGAGKKVNSHGLADPARLQEARARWLGELAVQESKLALVSRLGKVVRGTSVVARRTCEARK
ncbi:hypothetical protein CRG98_006040 [Punica granatum]|uniref:Uncharacterized protein n=1 Tax=Punica granatum TaxID=22663 RepID=A0A2I0KYR1_PUNGR|nr:hypothetical protein CRG98_006040 [Punica granatum]